MAVMGKAVIIGGAGFIGSHLTRVCLARGWEVVVYDNLSKGRRKFLPADARLAIVEGDILSTQPLRDTITACSPDVIFHLAAIHYIPECEQNPTRALRINVEGTQSVLDACTGVGARLIFTSTGAIYDQAIMGPLNEDSPIRAGDLYGITKQTCEELVRHWVAKGRGQACIARLFNAVGPRETNDHLIPAIMKQLVAGVRRIELGNLHPKRDYIHAGDIADALAVLGEMTMAPDLDIVNVGSGTEYTVCDLVAMFAEIIGEPIAIESVASRRRKYDRPNQLADIGRIRRHTSWSPTRGVKQALEEVWLEAAHSTSPSR